MAVIIYGTHDYGRVEGAGGEYATTRFFHIYFAPLFPTGSTWITGRGPEGPRGHATKLNGKSVAAGYLRVWGPIIALASLGAVSTRGSILALGVAVLALALTAWSWTWRTLRTARALRRSDYNVVAFGTRCEPRRMSLEMRSDLRRMLDARWDAREPDRSPNDVAQHGARDAEEAAIAYGLLRLAALRSRNAATEDRDADRILDDERVPLGANDGPYRATAETPANANGDSLAALVDRGRQMRAQQDPGLAPSTEQRVAQNKRSVRRARFGVAVATLFGLAGLPLFFMSVQPVLDADIKMLNSVNAPVSRVVRVTCDSPPSWLGEVLDQRGRVESRIALCELGKHVLFIRLDASDDLPGPVIQGTLRWIDDKLLWPHQAFAESPELEARALQVYMSQQSNIERIALAALGALFVLLAPVAWVVYIRWRRRTKAAEQAATSS